MIEYIRGELTDLTPTVAVVEAAGVGYALNISLNTYTAIQGKKEVKLYVSEALVTGGRDDSFTLYGFATKEERELYRQLITVSGVGANTARMILSSFTPAELCNAIAMVMSGRSRESRASACAPHSASSSISKTKSPTVTWLPLCRPVNRKWPTTSTRKCATRPSAHSPCSASRQHPLPRW